MLQLMKPSHETIPLPRDEARWDAVRRRDCAADGTFVYSVRTTGVYCRPVCPARTPLAKNVIFYPTAAAAQEAGLVRTRHLSFYVQLAEAAGVSLATVDRALNGRESVKADTVARIADDEYYITTGTGFATHDFHWISRNLTGDCQLVDVTSAFAVLSLMGPQARGWRPPGPALHTSTSSARPSGSPAHRCHSH